MTKEELMNAITGLPAKTQVYKGVELELCLLPDAIF